MKIAVMGAGAVGCYFGGLLAQAGEDVTLVSRGAHLEALKKRGLRITSPGDNIVVGQIPVTGDPWEVGLVDIILLTVKMWDVEDTISMLKPMLHAQTAVVSLQNGVDAESILIRRLGKRYVMGGVSFIAATIAEPGHVRQTGNLAGLVFGEVDGERSSRGEGLLAACRQAGIRAILSQSIELEIWKKFVFLVGLSGVTCVTRAPLGPVLTQPETRDLLLATMEETVQVGRASGVSLDIDFAIDRLNFCSTLPHQMKSSMLNDLERGRRLELEWLSGTVCRIGKALEIPTPSNDFIYTALKLHSDGAIF